MYDTTHTPPLPLPIKIGDADLDGFPDLLFIVVTNDDKRVPKLAWNVRCGAGEPGCPAIQSQSSIKRLKEGTKKLFMSNLIRRNGDTAATETKIGGRGFVVASSGGDASILATFNDARSVSFLDIDEDGTLDIMVQRTGSGDEGKGKLGSGARVNLVKNNVWRDAFFLKAIGGSFPFGLVVGGLILLLASIERCLWRVVYAQRRASIPRTYFISCLTLRLASHMILRCSHSVSLTQARRTNTPSSTRLAPDQQPKCPNYLRRPTTLSSLRTVSLD